MVDFPLAAHELVALVHRVPRERLDGPGLGEWSLRELIAHASRAVTVVPGYIVGDDRPITAPTAEAYFRVMLDTVGDDAAVAERGRQESRLLGDDVATAVERRATDALARVPASGRVAVGDVVMDLGEYLRTRVLELTVHGIDIADAAGLAWEPPAAHVADALRIAAANAAERDGVEALRLLTGRRPSAGLAGIFRSRPAQR